MNKQHATPEADRRKKEAQTYFPFWTDPVTLSEEADQPELNLLGEKGYLRVGGGMFIVGPTEVGKSSLATQLAIEWGCNHPYAIIKTANNLPLRVLMVQSEDDRQDSREMARCIKFLKLTPEQKALVRKNVHFTQWRACGEFRTIEGKNGDEHQVEVSATERLLEVVENAIEKFGPVEIVIVKPLSAYAEEGVMSQKANQRLLYGQIDPFLTKHNCGIIFIHHTPKLKDITREKSLHALLYAGAGDATLSNWPRASLFIWPRDDENKLFEFKPGKRANRLGWEEASRFYKWSLEGIFWERASAEDVKRFAESEKGKKGQKISADALRRVFEKSDDEWIVRADLIETLIDEGFARATAHRAIKQGDGYQRHNLEYQIEGKILKIRWNGISILNPKWKRKSEK
jgi:AAA domain